jgi:hypothetical protein
MGNQCKRKFDSLVVHYDVSLKQLKIINMIIIY